MTEDEYKIELEIQIGEAAMQLVTTAREHNVPLEEVLVAFAEMFIDHPPEDILPALEMIKTTWDLFS